MVISRFTKGVVILNCAVPLTLLAWDALHNDLGANPVNFAIRTTGLLTIIFLLLTLAVTPAISLTRWSWLGTFRRVFGLYAFFYAIIHFGIFFFYDRAANIRDTLSEIGLRSYLLVGIIGVLLMVPLAVTSTNRMISRLGPKNWKLLHRLTYLAVIAGVLHFYMLVKSDTTRPIIAASIVGAFFAYRLIEHYLRLRYDSYQYRHAPPAPARELVRAKQWTGSMRVAKMFQETQGVRTFRLVMPNGTKLPFEFLPGQYLILQIEIEGKMVRRSYTIASSPTQTGYCELTIKREDQGLVSRHLHDALQHEALVTVTAPAGRFTFSGMEADRIVMIAGGVGITPLMSKIRYLTDIAWKGSIHLIFSVKTEQDIIFRRELDELQKRFPQLKVTVTLTRAEEATWTGERGRINADFLKRVAPDLLMSRVHLCGPTEMTDPIVALIRDLGVADQQIHVESFASPSRNPGTGLVPGAEPVPALADDADESAATLKFARSDKIVMDLAGKTILEIAEEQGISIPYDCRSGICGQCKIRLLAGTVTMAAEDALDRVDRSKGIILSCQARCRDDVVVDV